MGPDLSPLLPSPEPAQSQPRGCEHQDLSPPLSASPQEGQRPGSWATGLGQPLLPLLGLLLAQPYLPHSPSVSPPPGNGKGVESHDSSLEKAGQSRGRHRCWQLGSWAAGELVPGTVCPEPQVMSPHLRGRQWPGTLRRSVPGASPPPPFCDCRCPCLHPRTLRHPEAQGGTRWPCGLTGPGARLQPIGQGLLIPGCPQEARGQEQVGQFLCRPGKRDTVTRSPGLGCGAPGRMQGSWC